MIFKEFEEIMSPSRMKRYVDACDGDTRKAMTLYRLNLHLSQDMFTVISCFEVALRNAINKKLSSNLGADWLRESQMSGGIFDNIQCQRTRNIIRYAYNKRNYLGTYTSDGLLSDMDFGIWKYMFSNEEYRATCYRSYSASYLPEQITFISSDAVQQFLCFQRAGWCE